MKYYNGIFATTHIDLQNERMALPALESMIEQANQYYIPVNIEHDPRIPPIGRIISAQLKQLDDGEYAVEGVIEAFESGDESLLQAGDKREIRLLEHSFDHLDISYDRNYENASDQELIQDINSLLKTKSNPQIQIKKALDPISTLTIGGAFILGGVAAGFLGKIGSDAWDTFKEKLKILLNKKKVEEKEKLLSFEFTIENDGYKINVEVILSNPTDNDIESFLENGLKNIDAILPNYFNQEIGLKKIVMEYADNAIKVKFGVRKDAVPLFSEIAKGET